MESDKFEGLANKQQYHELDGPWEKYLHLGLKSGSYYTSLVAGYHYTHIINRAGAINP